MQNRSIISTTPLAAVISCNPLLTVVQKICTIVFFQRYTLYLYSMSNAYLIHKTYFHWGGQQTFVLLSEAGTHDLPTGTSWTKWCIEIRRVSKEKEKKALLVRDSGGVCLLTSRASAGGCSVGACQAGGVAQAGIVEGVARVIRLTAQGATEEGRTGARELPRYGWLLTLSSI